MIQRLIWRAAARSAAPAAGRPPVIVRAATARAITVCRPESGTVTMTITANIEASSENSSGSRIRAMANWKTALSPFAASTAIVSRMPPRIRPPAREPEEPIDSPTSSAVGSAPMSAPPGRGSPEARSVDGRS